MAQKPRTPVHFPRMKVRGRRNKAKLAERRVHRTVFPHVAMTQVSPNKARFDVIAEWQQGCQRLEIDNVTDGWGRDVPGALPRMVLRPAEAPRREPSFSMKFKLEGGAGDRLRELLFGEAPDGEG